MPKLPLHFGGGSEDTISLLVMVCYQPNSGMVAFDMIQLLNEDLAGEYQAIIAYTVYSQVLKGAAYTDIARELETHAGEELCFWIHEHRF